MLRLLLEFKRCLFRSGVFFFFFCEAKEWKKQFRNIKRLDIINGAGHCPHDEEPEKTNKLINEFIQETK